MVLNLKIVFFVSRKSLINFDNRGYSGIQPNTKATKKLLRAVIQSHACIEYKGIKRGPAEYNVAVFKYILECKKGNLHLLLYLKYSSVIGQIQFCGSVDVFWYYYRKSNKK